MTIRCPTAHEKPRERRPHQVLARPIELPDGLLRLAAPYRFTAVDAREPLAVKRVGRRPSSAGRPEFPSLLECLGVAAPTVAHVLIPTAVSRRRSQKPTPVADPVADILSGTGARAGVRAGVRARAGGPSPLSNRGRLPEPQQAPEPEIELELEPEPELRSRTGARMPTPTARSRSLSSWKNQNREPEPRSHPEAKPSVTKVPVAKTSGRQHLRLPSPLLPNLRPPSARRSPRKPRAPRVPKDPFGDMDDAIARIGTLHDD